MSHLGSAHQIHPFSQIKHGEYESNHTLTFADQVHYQVNKKPVLNTHDHGTPHFTTTVSRLLHKVEWKCATCCRGFASLKELGKHQRPTMSCLPFQCSLCPEFFPDLLQLRRHFMWYVVSIPRARLRANADESQDKMSRSFKNEGLRAKMRFQCQRSRMCCSFSNSSGECTPAR